MAGYKKKGWTLGVAAGVGAVVLVTSGVGAMAGTNGYEAYKEALMKTKDVTNFATDLDVTLSDNGTQLIAVDSQFAHDRTNRASSGTAKLTSGDTSYDVAFYGQDGQKIVKTSDSDVYKVYQGHAHDATESAAERAAELAEHHKRAAEHFHTMEPVVDALFGNLKQYVTLETNDDGSKQVAVSLTGAQIPTVVQALGAVAVKKASESDLYLNKLASKGHAIPAELLKGKVPQLTSEVSVKAVELMADISQDDLIEMQTAKLVVTGKDANGVAHELALNLQADLRDFNAAQPATIDLTGKQTEVIEQQKRGHGRW